MKFGVVQFPGSNCDDDAHHAIEEVIGQPAEFIWHQSEQVSGFPAALRTATICAPARSPVFRRL
jgi:phosphoribosylformylglycinamidine (FGAM) synthase-like amidotransferase family enzyme